MIKHSHIIQIAIIIILCAIIYVPSLQNGFIWDDNHYVYKNPLVQRMDGLKRIWFRRETPQYYPIVFTTFWTEHKLWGLNPFGYHFVNMLLHMTNALLLFQVIRKIYPRGAFPVALLFAIHPIQVETVAWISELKNLLSLCFFLLAMLSYLQFDLSKKFTHYLRTLGLFVCALLSKSISVCFVFVPIIYKWWRNGKISWREIRVSMPFFFIGLLSGVNTIYWEMHKVGAKGHEFGLTFLERLILAGRILLFYPYKICFPFEFIFFYPRWEVDVTQWWQWVFLVISIMVFLSFFYLRNTIGRGAFALSSFYFISIFPALGFINVYPMVYSFVADHFSYLSLPPLLLLLCGSVIFLFDKITPQKSLLAEKFSRYRGFIFLFLAIPAIAYMCLKSMDLTRIYKDQFTLWEYLIHKNPSLSASYINLGNLYYEKGDNDKAISLYRKAIELDPDNPTACYDLGNVYMEFGMYEKAVFLFKQTTVSDLRQPSVYNNLGLSYIHLGRSEEAMKQFGIAIEIDPHYKKAFINLIKLIKERRETSAWPESEDSEYIAEQVRFLNDLGVIEGKAGDIRAAIALFNEALAIDPDHVETCNNLGYAYYRIGNNDRAEEYFKTALEIDPDNEQARVYLGHIKKRGAPSAEEAKEGLSVPEKVELLNKTGVEKGKAGDFDGAISSFKEAVELDPNYAESYNSLGYAYFKKGEYKLAEEYFKKALEANPSHEKARINLDYLYDSGYVSKKGKEPQ